MIAQSPYTIHEDVAEAESSSRQCRVQSCHKNRPW